MLTATRFLRTVGRCGHAQRAWRHRQLRRWQRPPVAMPTRFMDRSWPHIPNGPRCLRWPLNFARWYQARISWGTIGWLHIRLAYGRSLTARALAACLLASWLWVTAVAYLLAGLAAGVLLLTITLPLRLAGLALSTCFAWRGWTAPGEFNALDHAVLARIEASIDRTPPTPTRPVDPWDWNHDTDPQLQIQRAMVDQLAEANRIAALDVANRQPTQPPPAAPMPGIETRLSLRGPLVVLAVAAALMSIGAWRLHHGTPATPTPPSWNELHSEPADPQP